MPDKKSEKSVFEQTYHFYLNQVFSEVHSLSAERLGISVLGEGISIDLLNCSYLISRDGIVNPSGERPSFDVCVVLLKYLLTNRNSYPQDKNWCSYRDLKDSNPLLNYFKTNVEDILIREYSGNITRLKESGKALGGITVKEQFSQDISLQFNLLPRIPVLLLFNDRDEEFPASCSVLFERRAENYLDAECLAIAGKYLAGSLIKKAK